MTNGYVSSLDGMQRIDNFNQVVGSLHLPAGKYIIFGKANAFALKFNGTMDLSQGFECRLLSGGEEDRCLLNLWPESSDGGNWGSVSLNIGVTLPNDGKVEMLCSCLLSGDILLFNVVISAIQVEALFTSSEKPVTQPESKFRQLSNSILLKDTIQSLAK
jgi:hypothetical protein